MKKIIMNPITMAAFGAVIGASAQLSEYPNCSSSQMSSVFMLWTVLCIGISLHSDSRLSAAVLVGFFCLALVPAFYFTGYLLMPGRDKFAIEGFMIGWMIFAMLTPLIALAACHARGSGLTPMLFRQLLIAVPVAVKLIIFRDLTMFDLLFAAVLYYMLYVKKVGRVYNI